MKPFSLIYFLLSALLYVVALPLLLLFSLRPKYRRSIPARFFLKRNPPLAPGGIWFHACSVGETRALKPLLDPLAPENVRITTITQTGQDVAGGYGVQHRYLPYELFMPFWVRPQRALVVLEAEFWYLLFAVARARGARVILLNARLSERSFPKYLKLRWFYRRLFARVDKVFCQSEEDKARFKQLGAADIEVIGNIKLAQSVTAAKTYAKPDGETIVAASTHEGEEAIILEAFRSRYAAHPDSRLLVVPRHPERFDAVWEMLHQQCDGERIARWSRDGGIEALTENVIVLVDVMGELNNLYAISDIAVLGGAFKADVGGHNPLEPAHFGCRTITGTHFFNQRELMRYVDNISVVENNALTEVLGQAEQLRPAAINGSVDLQPFFDYLDKESIS